MYRIRSCPSCESTQLTFKWALVAPFLASYAVNDRPFTCKLLECSDCSLRFFDMRLSPEEVGRLYSGYRGEDYFRERHRHEFWYSRAVNDGIGSDPEEIAKRVSSLERFLRSRIEMENIDTVLDYGGDRGQFIPTSLGRNRFVFELSNATPVPGVHRIDSERDLEARKYDLVMLLGVLEHCSDPSSILAKVRQLMLPGGLLCVGVPHERYGLRFVSDRDIYGRYLQALVRFPMLLRVVDFYSTAGRVRLDAVPPLGFVKCHEHLNFFNEKSMMALLKRSNFETLDARIETVAAYPAKNESLTVLARLGPC